MLAAFESERQFVLRQPHGSVLRRFSDRPHRSTTAGLLGGSTAGCNINRFQNKKEKHNLELIPHTQSPACRCMAGSQAQPTQQLWPCIARVLMWWEGLLSHQLLLREWPETSSTSVTAPYWVPKHSALIAGQFHPKVSMRQSLLFSPVLLGCCQAAALLRVGGVPTVLQNPPVQGPWVLPANIAPSLMFRHAVLAPAEGKFCHVATCVSSCTQCGVLLCTLWMCKLHRAWDGQHLWSMYKTHVSPT